jgi:hypothetical protein
VGAIVAAAQRVLGGAAATETEDYLAYAQVIAKTEAMAGDAAARQLAVRHGLQILNLTWEDTGRFKDSAVGPNISDMTIQVQQMDPRTEKFKLSCMPVIRFPNFTDKTGDISPDRFFLLVGNERGSTLRRVTLREFLGDLRRYLSRPESWKGGGTSLLAKRDSHVLVSAQACFLPIAKGGGASFNPVLFNYQSYGGDPAVLTVLVTREGTSVTVIDNERDGFQAGRTWGQRLFFNLKGERASLTGKRISDFLAETPGKSQTPESHQAAGQEGLNMVLLIQVPLKQRRPRPPMLAMPSAPPMAMAEGAAPGQAGSNVEAAVIGHGKVEGPFTEIDNLPIERDTRFPIRVTVQFYKATSNGIVSEQDIAEIAAQIAKVYNQADYVGSLVVGGETGRPTEHTGPQVEPPGWWDAFWRQHEQQTGMTREQTLRMLRDLLGPNWQPRTEAELRDALRRAEALRKPKNP